jgi:predicted nuclease of predicted toxin-antitoxin system
LKFLTDVGVSQSTVQWLRSAGHDVAHLPEQGLERMADTDMLAKARAEGRIALTFDLDFGELMAAGRHSCPSDITFRLRNQRPENANRCLARVLAEQNERLAANVIVTIEETGYRLRQLPIFG